jgi:hypothetical protein
MTNTNAALPLQLDDALWDAIAIPGQKEPRFIQQHDRACRVVAEHLQALATATDEDDGDMEMADYVEREKLRDALDDPDQPPTPPTPPADRAAEAQPEHDSCRTVDIGGETIRIRGVSDLTEQEQEFVAEIVRAAKRRYAAEQQTPEPDAELRARLEAAINTARIWHATDGSGTWGYTDAPAITNAVLAALDHTTAPDTGLREQYAAAMREHWLNLDGEPDADPVRCPLCPDARVLDTPAGARAHFTTAHPEQRLVGSGPWPLLANREQPADRAALADEEREEREAQANLDAVPLDEDYDHELEQLCTKLAKVRQRAENAETRLQLARGVLAKDGYFDWDEIGLDIAPRLVEWLVHHRDRAEQAEATIERVRDTATALYTSAQAIEGSARRISLALDQSQGEDL